MLTKNAYALIGALGIKAEGAPFTLATGGIMQLCLFGNTGNDANYRDSSSCAFNEIWSSGGRTDYNVRPGLFFGDGTTAPTPSDYKLSGDAIAGITYPTTKCSYSAAGGYFEFQATVPITNSNTTTVTIKEIGLFGNLYILDRNTTKPFMMDHTVLTTPITLAAGETKSITLNYRFTYPTA